MIKTSYIKLCDGSLFPIRRYVNWPSVTASLLADAAKKRKKISNSAHKRDLEFNLTTQDVRQAILEFINCPACGFHFKRNDVPEDQGMAATIDRIDASQGYVKGNIQVMCHTCNQKKDRDTVAYLPRSQWHEAAQGLWYPELTYDLINELDD